MSTAIIRVEKDKMPFVKKLMRQLNGSIEVIKDKKLEEMLEDHWLGTMMDEAEKEPGEVSYGEIKKMFAKDGIAL